MPAIADQNMMFPPSGPSPFLHPSWAQAIEALAVDPGLAMVLGASDTGKTTWIASAVRQLGHAERLPLAIVDADIGQSTIGPPATVALGQVSERPGIEGALPPPSCQDLAFVGAVSPIGHLLQMLVGTKRLVEKALRSRAQIVLVDTTGLIGANAGFQLKLRKIELIAPKHLVVLQRDTELEALLSVVRKRPGLRIHNLEISGAARPRTAAERAAYRAQRFAAYFANARRLALQASRLSILPPTTGRARLKAATAGPLLQPDALREEDLTGLLLGLNDSANGTLGLGLLDGASEDGRTLYVLTPLTDAGPVRILQMGSLRLERSGQER